MLIKKVRAEDFYSTLLSWIEGHEGFPKLSIDLLSEYIYVAFNKEDIPIYSCCLYNTDSNICWIGWPVSNPEASKEDRANCKLDMFFHLMSEEAKNLGYRIVFTTSGTESVENALIDSGYMIGDMNVNHYLKIF